MESSSRLQEGQPWLRSLLRRNFSLIRLLLTADDIFFGDPPLFFKELKQELVHPFYPEIVLGWLATKPELLSLTDHHLDYSLHEAPVISNDGYDDTNESPLETSALIVDLTKRFLSLYPHERTNLSVVLYNCDSARLPHALVDKMTELHEDEEDTPEKDCERPRSPAQHASSIENIHTKVAGQQQTSRVLRQERPHSDVSPVRITWQKGKHR